MSRSRDERDAARIGSALSVAYERAARESLPARLVVLSDQHMGNRDEGPDDFERCEPAYCAALATYLRDGWDVALNGDVLELWENRREAVEAAYPEVLALHGALRDAGRLWEFYGNHDLARRGEPGVREAVRFEHEGRTVFVVHGHQGSLDSDGWRAAFSRLVVRYLWRAAQARMLLLGVSPATDYALRGRHNRLMYEWAASQSDGRILVCGHTHKPVLRDSAPTEPRVTARSGPVRAFQEARRRVYRRPFTMARAFYLNSGCCCEPDGDPTMLEFEAGDPGAVRLVQWSHEDGSRRVLAQIGFRAMLRETAPLRSPGPLV